MEALIGINPDDEVQVEYRKAVFTLGVVDAQMWNLLHHRYMKVYTEALRRSIAAATEGEEESEKFLRITRDDQYVEDVFPVYAEAIRFSVRNHDRILIKGGGPLPFETEEAKGRKVVSSKTLRYYGLIPGLFEFLYQNIRSLHRLEEDAKKD